MADVLTMYADKVTRVTLSGKMLNGSEIWQTGFYLGKAAGGSETPTQAVADAIRDLWVTFFTATTNGISNSYTFEEVKLARLNKDGRYDGSDVITSHPTAQVKGGSAGQPLPPQVALVATLVAGSGKGLAGKGRMYLPGVSTPVDSTGHIPTVNVDAVRTNLTTFFTGVYNIAGIIDVPVNASKGHIKLLGAGNRSVPINGVRVGNVYDTQRRRRGALQEVYSQSGLIQRTA